jgi:hypothetical protein
MSGLARLGRPKRAFIFHNPFLILSGAIKIIINPGNGQSPLKMKWQGIFPHPVYDRIPPGRAFLDKWKDGR